MCTNNVTEGCHSGFTTSPLHLFLHEYSRNNGHKSDIDHVTYAFYRLDLCTQILIVFESKLV